MKVFIYRLLGIILLVAGVGGMIFGLFQANIIDTQRNLEYLVLNRDTLGIECGLSLGAIFAGLGMLNEAPYI